MADMLDKQEQTTTTHSTKMPYFVLTHSTKLVDTALNTLQRWRTWLNTFNRDGGRSSVTHREDTSPCRLIPFGRGVLEARVGRFAAGISPSFPGVLKAASQHKRPGRCVQTLRKTCETATLWVFMQMLCQARAGDG